MKSNERKTSVRRWAILSGVLGGIAWVVGFFAFFAFSQYRGLYVFFALMSIALLVMYIKMAGVSSQTEGAPLKRTLYGSAVCAVLQILFFGALAILGPAAGPKAGSLFFCFTALYLVCPVLIHYGAKKHGL